MHAISAIRPHSRDTHQLLFAAGISRLRRANRSLSPPKSPEVKKGYRRLAARHSVTKTEWRIGTIAEWCSAQDLRRCAVLEVGGFIGIGGHIVAVQIATLIVRRRPPQRSYDTGDAQEYAYLPEFNSTPEGLRRQGR